MSNKINWNKLKELIESTDSSKVPKDLDYSKPMDDKRPSVTSEIITASGIPRDHLNPFVNARVEDIANTLAILLYNGLIDIQNLKGKVIDFGCGVGASAHVLKQYGGDVVGLELNPKRIEDVIQQGILPAEKTYVGDGFEYLDQGVEPNSVNLVATFRIMNDFPLQRLYESAQRILRPNGQLVVTGQTDAEALIKSYQHIGRIHDGLSEHCLVYTKPSKPQTL